MSRSEDDPINKILSLFKQMQKVSKDIPNALINTAVDKKEEIQDIKTQVDILLSEIDERVDLISKLLEENKYSEETKKGCLTIDPSDYLQYINVEKERINDLIEQETAYWEESAIDTLKDAEA